MKLKYDKTMLKTANLWSLHSSCKRNQVGCVIAKDSRTIAIGYNGTLPNSNNNCEEDSETKPTVIHAEQNAIAFAAKNGIATKDTTMYITLSPCPVCALIMVQAGIKRVVYKEEYRDLTGLEILKEAHIEISQIMV